MVWAIIISKMTWQCRIIFWLAPFRRIALFKSSFSCLSNTIATIPVFSLPEVASFRSRLGSPDDSRKSLDNNGFFHRSINRLLMFSFRYRGYFLCYLFLNTLESLPSLEMINPVSGGQSMRDLIAQIVVVLLLLLKL